MNGWTHPLAPGVAVLADLFDLTALAHAGKRKPKPHPIRPWKNTTRTRYGNTGGRTREQVEHILRRARTGI